MLAKTYHKLPSEVLANANTFDIMVYDVMMAWEQEQQDKANGVKKAPELTQEQMLKMVAKTKDKAKEIQ
jgi:tRNA C32,U32 (ribose-2'-O)-methylase TrmJ